MTNSSSSWLTFQAYCLLNVVCTRRLCACCHGSIAHQLTYTAPPLVQVLFAGLEFLREPVVIHTSVMNHLRSEFCQYLSRLCPKASCISANSLLNFKTIWPKPLLTFSNLTYGTARVSSAFSVFAVQGPDFIVCLRLVLVRLTQARLLSIQIFLQVPKFFARNIENISMNFPHV